MVKLIESGKQKTHESYTMYSHYYVQCNEMDCKFQSYAGSHEKAVKEATDHIRKSEHQLFEISFHTGVMVNEQT